MTRAKRNATLAWILFGLILAGVLVTLYRQVFVLQGSNPWEPAVALSWGLIPIVFALVGALIIARQPRNVIGLLLMLPALAFAVPTATYLAGIQSPPASPSWFVFLVLWFDNWSWVLLVFPILFILVLFPTGQPITASWRWLIFTGIGMMLTMVFLSTFGGELGPVEEAWVIPNPIGFIALDFVNRYILPVWFVLLPALTLACAVALFVRFRRAKGVEREQIKWLFYASAIFVVFYVPTFFTESYSTANNVWDVLFVVAVMTVPAAITIAILRYRLYDIDIIIRRTLQYALLTGTLALVYFGGVIVLQEAFGRVTEETGSPLITVISTLGIAALFTPLRARTQDFIDRSFYRSKYDAEQILADFAATARDEVDLDALNSALLGAVDASMQPVKVSIWLKRSHVVSSARNDRWGDS